MEWWVQRLQKPAMGSWPRLPWPRLAWLLLPPLLWLPWSSADSCILDPEGDHCFCNFSAPEPEWRSLSMCISSIEVEIHGGGHNLDIFLQTGGLADPSKAADLLRALRLKRLKLLRAEVPAPLLRQLLRALTYTRVRELALQDLVISHLPLHPPSPIDDDLQLTTLHLGRVALAGEGDLLRAIGSWLKPDLEALSLTGLGLTSVPCSDLATFKRLRSLDLSDNPDIGESFPGATCLKDFHSLQQLALRNTSLKALGVVCQGLAATGASVQRLDVSYNELEDTPLTQCTWPPTLLSLNLSHGTLSCVPASLPRSLQQLDLSHNLLRQQPPAEMLPQVTDLILEGNPFTLSNASAHLQGKEVPYSCQVSSRGSNAVGTSLALQVSGPAALALLRGVRGFP